MDASGAVPGPAGAQIWLAGLSDNPVIALTVAGVAILLLLALMVQPLWQRFRSGKLAQTKGNEEDFDDDPTLIGMLANAVFLQFETLAYIMLGLLLSAAIVIGILGAAQTIVANAGSDTLVYSVDRLLFVLMVVEILRTVRDSFRSGRLVAEPFLIVGLIASIRRVLVITLEATQAASGSPQPADGALTELGVLSALILVLVISICLLRYSRRWRA